MLILWGNIFNNNLGVQQRALLTAIINKIWKETKNTNLN